MRTKCLGLSVALLFLVACTPSTGVDVARPDDPLTGLWTGDYGNAERRNPVDLKLEWDGAKLRGVVNPRSQGLELTKASFDPQTGAIKMELDAMANDRPVHFVIDGKVEGDTITGTWNRNDQQGDFKITKNKQGD